MSINHKERPIFIIGSERSGTTLLMTMIGTHPRIAVPEVAWYYPRFRPYLHTYGDLGQTHNLRTLANEMVFGLKTPFFGMKVNPAVVVDEIIEAAPEKSYAGLYSALFERYAREQGRPRWGEKTPHNLFFVKEILEDFPNAQFVFLTRDGRDASSEYLNSAFGPTNIYCAAEIWKLCQNAVKPARASLRAHQWLDIQYETLVKRPEEELKKVCDFLGESYSPAMLDFFKGDIAQRRGATRDHAPLGKPVSTEYIGRYKTELSLRDQRIFATVAGDELREAGYVVDAEPWPLSDAERAHYRELDGRTRAAVLDAPEGHIVYESYNDWLVDQREQRRQSGLWQAAPTAFPLDHPMEEEISGQRAPRKWKEYLSVKRQYVANGVVL